MKNYDICIIGGGILGCMAARELSRYQLKILLVEKEADVCCGITKANAGILYAGYDHKPGTRKGSMCVRGNARLPELCQQLDVPYKRTGSLMVGFGPNSEKVLRKKADQGRIKEVPGIELLTGAEVLTMEPLLNPGVTMGLYAPTTATVNPWELGIAVYENALANGCDVLLHREVEHIRYDRSIQPRCGGFGQSVRQRNGDGKSERINFEIILRDHTNGSSETIRTKGILNCAGIHADQIREMVLPPLVRIRPEKAAFLVFSSLLEQKPERIIFYEPEEKRKGLTLIPVTDGSLLIGTTEEEAHSRTDLSTTSTGLERLQQDLEFLVPSMDFNHLIRSFAGLRPRIYDVEDESRRIPGFVIDQSPACPEMVSLIGIKTPGLTSSQELAEYAIGLLLHGMQCSPETKKEFVTKRHSIKRVVGDTLGKAGATSPVKADYTSVDDKAGRTPRAGITDITSSYGKADRMPSDITTSGRILCHCNQITEAEVAEAIRRGATNIEGIRHRCGNGMGPCQGSRCEEKIWRFIQQTKNKM